MYQRLFDGKEFQSLFSWMKVADLQGELAAATTTRVSILVLLDEGCRRFVEVLQEHRLIGFNPCSLG